MQIERRAERFCSLQYRPEKLVVEIATALMAVDPRTGEGLTAKTAFELFGRARLRQHYLMRDHFWLNARLGNLRFFRTQLSAHLLLDIDQEPTGHCCGEGRDLQLASFFYMFLRRFGHYRQQHSA